MSTVTISRDWVGRVIDGRFRLLEWLGGSESSGVFLTELDGPEPQKAAIKVILADYAKAQEWMVSWAEAAKLSHPHLMPLLDSGRTQVDTTGVAYSVTEYADEVLADVLRERPLGPEEVKQMLVPLLDALFYLHGKRYVHGHLSPSNVLVVQNQLKLSTDELQVTGEPRRWFRALTLYDAPEVWDGNMTAAADVWSLGMTLAEALSLRTPEWERESGKEPAVPAGIPQPFARMVRECLKLNPAERCTLADLNKARFERIRGEDEPLERRRSARSELEDREEHEGRRRGLILAGAAVVVLLAIFAVVHWWPGSSPAKTQTPGEAAASSAGVAGAVEAGPPPAEPAKREKRKREHAAAKQEIPKPQAEVPETANTQSENSAAVSTAGVTGNAVQRVMPQPSDSALHTIHGTVRVRVKLAVDASGNVTDATFADAGPSQYFARLAMDAARKWQFAAGAAGERVVEFDFRRTGVEARVE